MISLLLFFFPAGLSVKIKDDFFKEELKVKDYVLLFMKYTVIINFLMFTILYFYSHGSEVSMSLVLDELGFIFKYSLISTFIAVIIPVVDEYLKKCINLKMSIKEIGYKNEKKHK